MTGPYALALTAGMAATVNPCGFALLPAYLSTFLSTGAGPDDRRRGSTQRAVAVAAVLTAGFVTVFGAFGLIVTPFALRIERHLPWVTIVIGAGLVALGAVLLTGRQIMVKLPKLQRGGSDGSLPSMFLFGVSYAIASLSCTIGPFLAVTTSTFRSESWLSGTTVFIVYGFGMGVIITILTVAVAVARDGVVQRFRGLLRAINRFAGALLVLAGAYVAYYGWYEIRIQRGAGGDPIVDRAIRVQQWLQDLVVPSRPVTLALVVGAIVAVLVGGPLTIRRVRARRARVPKATDLRGAQS